MDTAKGGYYVNKGTLEFKQLDSDESVEESIGSEEEVDVESEKDEQEDVIPSTSTSTLQPIIKTNNLVNNCNKPSSVSRLETLSYSPMIVRLSQGGVPPSRRITLSDFKKS